MKKLILLISASALALGMSSALADHHGHHATAQAKDNHLHGLQIVVTEEQMQVPNLMSFSSEEVSYAPTYPRCKPIMGTLPRPGEQIPYCN